MKEELTVVQKLTVKLVTTLGFLPASLILTYHTYETFSATASDIEMISTIQESAEEVNYVPTNSPEAIEDYLSVLIPALQKSGDVALDDARKDIL